MYVIMVSPNWQILYPSNMIFDDSINFIKFFFSKLSENPKNLTLDPRNLSYGSRKNLEP